MVCADVPLFYKMFSRTHNVTYIHTYIHTALQCLHLKTYIFIMCHFLHYLHQLLVVNVCKVQHHSVLQKYAEHEQKTANQVPIDGLYVRHLEGSKKEWH